MRDHLEIRRRALRAAAAAAGLSALSCSDGAAGGGAQSADVGVSTDVGAVHDAADTATADAADAADTASADTATADAADTASADAATADAVSADASADADATSCAPLGDGEPDCKALQGEPSWATCCDDHLAYCVALHGADTPATNDCHFGPDFSGQCTGCIPWGPPAPPRFDLAWRPRVVGNGAVFEVV